MRKVNYFETYDTVALRNSILEAHACRFFLKVVS